MSLNSPSSLEAGGGHFSGGTTGRSISEGNVPADIGGRGRRRDMRRRGSKVRGKGRIFCFVVDDLRGVCWVLNGWHMSRVDHDG